MCKHRTRTLRCPVGVSSMRDRWEYIRERDRLFDLEAKTYGHHEDLPFHVYHTLVDRRNILHDADALLKVVIEDVAYFKKLWEVSTTRWTFDEWLKHEGRYDKRIAAILALPEHLR